MRTCPREVFKHPALYQRALICKIHKESYDRKAKREGGVYYAWTAPFIRGSMNGLTRICTQTTTPCSQTNHANKHFYQEVLDRTSIRRKHNADSESLVSSTPITVTSTGRILSRTELSFRTWYRIDVQWCENHLVARFSASMWCIQIELLLQTTGPDFRFDLNLHNPVFTIDGTPECSLIIQLCIYLAQFSMKCMGRSRAAS